MSISYADVGLTPPYHTQDVITQYWHGYAAEEFDHPGYLVSKVQHLPVPYPPQRRPPRVGVLNWPTGADRFAVCHLWATGVQLAAVRTALGTDPQAKPLVFNDGARSITAQMYLIGVRPISDRADGREFYLLTLVDQRYFWWQSGDSSVPSDPSSWTDLISGLFGALGVSASITTPDSAYLTPNVERWAVGVQPIPIVLEAACRQVGMRVVCDLDGVVTVVNVAGATDDDTARWQVIKDRVLAGGRVRPPDIARGLPASLDVVYFDGSSASTTLASLAITELEGVLGVTNGRGLVMGDPAELTGAQRTAYTARAARDYYKWALCLTDCTIRGMDDTPPTGMDDFIEYVHAPGGDLVTRIVRPPWSDRNSYGSPLPAGEEGSFTDYQDDCLNGYHVRMSRTVNFDGTVEDWELDRSYGILCGRVPTLSGSGQSGSGGSTAAGPPNNGGPTMINFVSSVCPTFPPCVEVSVNYRATEDDCVIYVNAASGAVRIDLPPWYAGGFYKIVKTDSSINAVTIKPAGSDEINNLGTFTLTVQWTTASVEARCTSGPSPGGWAVLKGV